VSTVQAYFDGAADGYHDRSTRWPWSLVRAGEASAVMELLGDVTGLDVLDLGCGAGYYTRRALDAGARRVAAVDISARMLAALDDPRVERHHADACSVAPGREFPAIICAGAIEFVSDPLALLTHARTLAAPGARLALLAPERSLLGRVYRRFHAGHGVGARLFARDELVTLAVHAGWWVTATRGVLPFATVLRLEVSA
jgi:SAM-dependent methyltransferase